MNCQICKAPYNEASGHRISDKTVWCGPCTASWAKEVRAMQKRKWGGLEFYKYAKPPPPAVEFEYVFTLYPGEQVNGTSVFKLPTLTAKGVNVEDAYAKIATEIPEGKRIIAITEGP